MRKDAILLGGVAAVAATNLACLVLLLRAPAPAAPPASPRARSESAPVANRADAPALPAAAGTDADLSARLAAIDARLAALAQEVHALAERPAAAGETRAASAQDPGGTLPSAPAPEKTRVQRMLDATQSAQKYWEDMENLSAIEDGMEPAEFMDLLYEKTAGFLELDTEGRKKFREVMSRRITEHRAIQAEQTNAYQARSNWSSGGVTDPKEREAMMAEYRQIQAKIGARRQQFADDVRAELSSFFDPENFQQKAFLARVDEWFGYVVD